MHTPSSIRPDMVALACFPVSKPATRSTPEEVAALGTSLIPLLSDDQLSAAMAAYFSSAAGTRKSYLVGYRHLRQVVANHWRSCIKMPAGGAHAGGAQQSGFEVQLVPSFAVKQLFQEHTVKRYIIFHIRPRNLVLSSKSAPKSPHRSTKPIVI